MKPVTFSAPCIKRFETDEFRPSGQPRFVAVSLNGMRCHLQCDHCKTRMLGALYQAGTPERFLEICDSVHARGCRGMLLTGGCDRDGTIPLPRFVDAVRLARQRFGFRYAVHTKLVTPQLAEAAAAIGADLLMNDVVGDDESIREVYHLRDKSTRDIEASLDQAAAAGLALAPHILIGIARGAIVGEYRALDMLRGRRIAVLCLVVLTPLRNTPLQGVAVDVAGALEVMSAARRAFPETRLTLGCVKTSGKSQRMLEEHALALEFDAIAYPSEGLVDHARALGHPVRFTEACCSFVEWTETDTPIPNPASF
jgi:uncharacterized radical SAM superfamily protein